MVLIKTGRDAERPYAMYTPSVLSKDLWGDVGDYCKWYSHFALWFRYEVN